MKKQILMFASAAVIAASFGTAVHAGGKTGVDPTAPAAKNKGTASTWRKSGEATQRAPKPAASSQDKKASQGSSSAK